MVEGCTPRLRSFAGSARPQFRSARRCWHNTPHAAAAWNSYKFWGGFSMGFQGHWFPEMGFETASNYSCHSRAVLMTTFALLEVR